MKRGEVVDAETAVKIMRKYKHFAFADMRWDFAESLRPVIWPEKNLPTREELIKQVDYVNLLERPCARPLIHIICYSKMLLTLASVPQVFSKSDSYALYTNFATWSYAGDDQPNSGIDIFVDNEDIKNEMLKVRATQNATIRARLGIQWDFTQIHSIETIDLDFRSKAGTALLLAIGLERFAFDTHTISKPRPAFSGRTSARSKLKEWPPIEIINLRLPEKKEESDSEGRELTIRFYVKGHFRRQWRPSTKDHKLIWIEEHIRGPKDAPLKPKPTKVYKVTR